MNFKTIMQPDKKMTYAVVRLRQGCNHMEALLSQPDSEFVEFRNAITEKRPPYCSVDAGRESLICSAGSILSNDARRPLSRQEIIASKIGE